MTSITWLKDKIEDIETMMNSISIDIRGLEDEINTKTIRLKDRNETFNRLDEETVELNEAITLLEENNFKDLHKRNDKQKTKP